MPDQDERHKQYQAIVDQLCAINEQARMDLTLYSRVFYLIGDDGKIEYVPADTVLARSGGPDVEIDADGALGNPEGPESKVLREPKSKRPPT